MSEPRLGLRWMTDDPTRTNCCHQVIDVSGGVCGRKTDPQSATPSISVKQQAPPPRVRGVAGHLWASSRCSRSQTTYCMTFCQGNQQLSMQISSQTLAFPRKGNKPDKYSTRPPASKLFGQSPHPRV